MDDHLKIIKKYFDELPKEQLKEDFCPGHLPYTDCVFCQRGILFSVPIFYRGFLRPFRLHCDECTDVKLEVTQIPEGSEFQTQKK